MSDLKNIDSPSVESTPDDEIDLIALAKTLWERKWLIASMATVTALTGLTLSLMLPKKFVAEATILPTTSAEPGAALAAGLASQFAPVAGMLGNMTGGKSADLVEVLNSRSMIERVIAKCQLDRKLKGWEFRSDLILQVRKMTSITPPSLKVKSVNIAVKAHDPQIATDMANAYLDELKVMLDEIGYNNASKNRRFIQDQLATTKEDLTKAENQLADFQANSHIASLPDTVVATIKSISDLEAERIRTDVQLKAINEALEATRDNVASLQADPNLTVEMELKRRSLVAQEGALARAKNSFQEQLTSLPPKGVTLARLQRDVQVHNAVYLILTQQLATAELNENKESDAFLPLDKAIVPDRPVSPKKSVFTLAGFAAGLLLGALLALFLPGRPGNQGHHVIDPMKKVEL